MTESWSAFFASVRQLTDGSPETPSGWPGLGALHEAAAKLREQAGQTDRESAEAAVRTVEANQSALAEADVELQNGQGRLREMVHMRAGTAALRAPLAEAWEARRLALAGMADAKKKAAAFMQKLPADLVDEKRAELLEKFGAASATAAAEEARLTTEQEKTKVELDVTSSMLLELSGSISALSIEANTLEEQVKNAEAALGASRLEWKRVMKGAAAAARNEEKAPAQEERANKGNSPAAGVAGEPLHMEQLGKLSKPASALAFLSVKDPQSADDLGSMTLHEAAKSARVMLDNRALREIVLAMAALALRLSIPQKDHTMEHFLEVLGDEPGLRDTTAPGQAAALEIRKHPYELSGANTAEAARRAEVFLKRAVSALEQFPRDRTVWDSIVAAVGKDGEQMSVFYHAYKELFPYMLAWQEKLRRPLKAWGGEEDIYPFTKTKTSTAPCTPALGGRVMATLVLVSAALPSVQNAGALEPFAVRLREEGDGKKCFPLTADGPAAAR